METVALKSALLERMPAMQKVLAANAAEVDRQGSFPKGSLETLGKLDLMGLLVPEADGGAGASAALFAATLSALGQSCASTAMIFLMHCCATEVIVRYGAPSLKTSLLKDIAKGKHLTSLACSEPGTGATFFASYSISKPEGDGFALTGVKAFVTSGGHADSYVVSTQSVDADNDCLKTTLYLVPSDAKGMKFEGEWNGVGLRGNSSIKMNLENCVVQGDRLLGNQGQGLELEMSTVLPRFLLGTACVYNGIATAAFNATVEHVKGRTHQHTSQSLASNPVIRYELAQMKVALDATNALLLNSVRDWDHSSKPDLVALFGVKQLACKMAADISRAAMQLCGGIAYSSRLPIERHLRDALAGSVMAPTNEMLLDLIGRAALDLPLMG